MAQDEGAHRCFMGQLVPEGGGEERFFVIALTELTIYGHTCDQWTKENYPEDMWATERVRSQGNEFGCFHSVVVPDGELGSQDGRIIREIRYETFIAAWDGGWPKLELLTAPADLPVVRMMDLETGEVIYDSLRDTPTEEGDADS